MVANPSYPSSDQESLSSVTDYSDHASSPPSNECIPDDTVAIVGMGCRWPGGVSRPSQLWDLLANGKSGYREFDDSKLNITAFHHPNQQRPGSTPARGAYQLQEDPRLFDHAFFGITPTETLTLDPQHRKLLEVVYEAFENAGEPWEKLSGSRTGVFVGNFTTDHSLMQSRDMDNLLPYATTGGSSSILSNRINYIFNLHGPSLTLDTACSSSLYALHLAVNAIKNGDCDSAIVGAGNLILSPDLLLSLSRLGALSPTATCHVFDAAADGYARGEGFAAFYLKRTVDAVAGSYPIRSVIRGTAINSNGRTAGITHPSAEGQVEVIRQAYATAKLDPSLTGYFEAHGTGTQVGDPIEVNAIGQVFSKSSETSELRIGSIKSNIGHTEAASGMAGLMKCILAMEHGLIPPTIGITHLNPKIDFKGAHVRPVTKLEPWPSGRLRRASINSFGYGGANGHCILDDVSVALPGYTRGVGQVLERQQHNRDKRDPIQSWNHTIGGPAFQASQRPYQRPRRMLVLPFSAREESTLNENMRAISDAMKKHEVANLAYTLSARRSNFKYRTFRIVETSHSKIILDIKSSTPLKPVTRRKPNIGLVFTGQGAQWEGMGADLMEYAVFRNSIAHQDAVLKSLSNSPEWSIHDIISRKTKGKIHDPFVSQTVCTALQVAIIDMLQSWSIEWTASVGHSSGEIAATYAAGLITADEAIIIAYCRGIAVAGNNRSGLMLAVGLGRDEIELYLSDFKYTVRIAAINSPASVTLSGDTASVMELYETLLKNGVFAKLLQTGRNAYHSHHMSAVGVTYVELLEKALSEPRLHGSTGSDDRQRKVEWFSSATPDDDVSLRTTSPNPTYWQCNLQSPVQFSQAVENMVASQVAAVDVLIEVGPHSALKSPLRQILSHVGKEFSYFATLRRHEDGLRNMLGLGGSLFCLDAQIDLTIANSTDRVDERDNMLGYTHGSVCVDLPPYAYNYGPIIYHENRLSKENRLRRYLKHDILGLKQPGGSRLRPSWRNVLRVKDVPWLSHHKLAPQTVFPASAYICMAIEAASQLFQNETNGATALGFTIRNLSLRAALVIPETDTGIEVVLDLDASKAEQSKDKVTWYAFKISSVTIGTGVWTEHCSGIIRPNISRSAPTLISDEMDRRTISAQKWYRKLCEVGLDYGESFRGLSELTSDPVQNIAQGKVALQSTCELFNGPESPYIVHPASLDMCAQLALIAAHGGQVERMTTAYVPSFVGELSIWVSTTQGDYGRATAKGARHGLRGAHAQAQLVNSSGDVMLDILDIRCTAYSGGQDKETITKSSGAPYMRLVWKPYLEKMSREQARFLFPPIETNAEMELMFMNIDRLGALMVADISDRFGGRVTDCHLTEHFQRFLAWTGRMASLESPLAEEAAAISSPERALLISDLCDKLQEVIEIPISKRIFDNLGDILSGTKSSLELVRQDDAHSQMYNSGLGISAAYTQLERVVDLLAHVNPSMNILEIGAGTGGATRITLKTLNGGTHLRRYNAYTFTDISSGYFLEARDEFSECHAVNFGILNIEQPPSSQGFEPIYDLIIASCSIHVTKDINLTLSNARALLRPGGKILILECTQPNITHGLVLGTLPDYWVGTEEARVDSPFLPVNEWESMLNRTGFSGIDIELDDYPRPYTMISTFLSTAVDIETEVPTLDPSSPNVGVISLLDNTKAPDIKLPCVGPMREQTYQWYTNAESLPEESRVVVLYDSSSSPTESDAQLGMIKELFSKAYSVLWINVEDHSVDHYPYAGLMNGLLRVIAAENPSISYVTINLQRTHLQDRTLMKQILVLEKEFSGNWGTSYSGHAEYRVIRSALSISRLVPDLRLNDSHLQADSTQTQLLSISDQPPLAAYFATPGILSSVFFEEDTAFWKQFSEDQIEVKTVAVGLNWKDLAVSAGRLDLDNFSSECSGIVTRIGSAVKDFQIGDKVFGISKGKFGNYMRCYASLVQHMEGDDFAQAAAVPIVYMTALYALDYLARIEPGDKVLIQSASGGFGIAALNVARQAGADIWATVGNDDKRAFLQDTYGIPDAQIFSSRTTPDVEIVKQRAGDAGFDIILSTGSGDGFNEWLRCLAPSGHFIDVGRVDVQDHASMHLEVFKRNATLSSFDLSILIETKPTVCSKLLAQVAKMLHNNTVPAISPIKTFDISQLAPALLYLSKGTHVGKIVVTYDDSTSVVNMVPPNSGTRFDSEAKYVLVGGLGGLGNSIISWMAQRGARRFVALSRSAPTQAAAPFMSSISAQGCVIEHICCNVSKLSDVEAAIAEASQPSGVIKGIIHSAVSLQDKLFDSLSFSEWQQGLAVKVDGTINLHKASLHLPLEFFVMVSSNSAQVALPTQATYCASNNFQNEFARYRRSLGLPATAMELGLIEEAGDLGQNRVYHSATMRNGLYHTSEHGFLEHLEQVFHNASDSQISDWREYDAFAEAHLITSLDPAKLLKLVKAQRESSSTETSSIPRWHSDTRFSHIIRTMENLKASDETASTTVYTPSNSNADAQAALTEVDSLVKDKDIEGATSLVIKSIIARMADMLFISSEGIDATNGVAAYGMDSLIAAELRNWFVRTYKCTISFLKLLDAATSITELADIVVESRIETSKV